MFRRVLEVDERHAGARTNLAWFLFQRRDLEGARALLERAVADEPTLMEAWFYLGQVHRRAGRGDEAVAALREAEELAPTDPDIPRVLGIVLCDDLHRPDEALVHFRRGLELQPGAVDLQIYVGVACRNKGDFAGAVAAARAALALDPASVRARRDLAECLVLSGDWDAGIPAFREALAADPAYSLGVQVLAQLLTLHEDPAVRDPAESLRLLDRLPDEPVLALYRALALLRLGRAEEGLGILEASEDDGADPWRPFALAVAHVALGRLDEARAFHAEGVLRAAKDAEEPSRDARAMRAWADAAVAPGGGR
jgi:Flp pilus assembly protein TadD